MAQEITRYDEHIKSVDWLAEADLPVAITLTEVLESTEGRDAIIFPPTFAVKGAPHPYQIDKLDDNLTPQEAEKAGLEANNCLIDSVGSQANRMESVFQQPRLSELVPQIMVKLNDEVGVNLLDVGHRIADGAVRFSGLRDEVTTAIEALRDSANAEPLARLSPTSLIFGFWDSRPNTTMYKFGRMLSSTIRATNVAVVKRSAQFNPAFDPTLLGLADELPDGEAEAQDSSGKAADGKDPLSKLGLRAAPAVNTHGGVRVFGQTARRTQINLVRLRALAVTKDRGIDEAETLKLRRYVLGLALVAARAQTNYDLREGCLLRCVQSQAYLTYSNNESEPFEWRHGEVYEYAKEAAREFGVGSPREVRFDAKAAREGVETAKKAAKEKPSKKNK
ncbi:MAG TPA: type I-U CRISPR-associated RAMP protein Csb1/Cas7u [Pyrinomonadaceae bacterium]|jgi:CRISPR-associated protein Csb1